MSHLCKTCFILKPCFGKNLINISPSQRRYVVFGQLYTQKMFCCYAQTILAIFSVVHHPCLDFHFVRCVLYLTFWLTDRFCFGSGKSVSRPTGVGSCAESTVPLPSAQRPLHGKRADVLHSASEAERAHSASVQAGFIWISEEIMLRAFFIRPSFIFPANVFHSHLSTQATKDVTISEALHTDKEFQMHTERVWSAKTRGMCD